MHIVRQLLQGASFFAAALLVAVIVTGVCFV